MHDKILDGVASAGYVIAGHKSGGDSGLNNYTSDQIRTFEWALDSEISQFIGWGAPVGVYGHSIGGGATLDSGADDEAI